MSNVKLTTLELWPSLMLVATNYLSKKILNNPVSLLLQIKAKFPQSGTINIKEVDFYDSRSCEALPEWMLHIFSLQNMRKLACGILNNNNTCGPLDLSQQG